MITSRKAESFVGIIVGVFILSIVILGIANLVIYSVTLIDTYKETTRIGILENNLANIIKKIDTSNIAANETFYIYKNNSTNTFDIFTGAINSGYQYIDKFGEYIPSASTYTGEIYSRTLWSEQLDTTFTDQDQIIKSSISKIIETGSL